MMTEIKKCLKLCKYGYQLKTNIFAGLLFFVLGMIWIFTSSGFNSFLGICYILLAPLFTVQISSSVLYANITLSSSLRKPLDGVFSNIIGAIASVFTLGMTYVGLLVNPKMQAGTLADSGNILIAAGIMIATIMIYYGASFKFFVGGIVVFFIAYLGIMAGCGILLERSEPTSLLMGSIIGILIAVAGNVLGGIIRKVLYKYSMDPLAGGNSLRKAMK